MLFGIPLRGVPTVVRSASDSNPAEGLIIPLSGTVSQLYAQGMVSAAVTARYGSEHAVQIEYAPYGKPAGLCTGVRRPRLPERRPEPAAVPQPGHHGVDHRYRRFAPDRAAYFVQHLTGNPGSVPANQLWDAPLRAVSLLVQTRETRMSVPIGDPADAAAIRPFTSPAVPDSELDALRARIVATRWPDRETVTDDSQGVPLGDAAGPRALLGDRLRLGQVRGEAERPAELPDRDRWA